MQIVIEVPEHIYEHIKEVYEHSHTVEATYSYIYHGTPLPKYHGRLIDENNLWFEDIDDVSCVTQRNVENAPTIIEADTESEG